MVSKNVTSNDRGIVRWVTNRITWIPWFPPTCQVFFTPLFSTRYLRGKAANPKPCNSGKISSTLLLEKIPSPKLTLPCEKGPSQKENHLPTAIFQGRLLLVSGSVRDFFFPFTILCFRWFFVSGPCKRMKNTAESAILFM